MLTARALRVRDWLLFALAALAPAIAVGILGFRALRNEEAAARREAALSLTASADRSTRTIKEAIAAATDRLRSAALEGDSARIDDALRGLAPDFAERVLLGSDRGVLVPAGGAPTSAAPPRCADLAADLARIRGAAERAAARRDLLTSCPEARAASGRWLWPILALEAPEPAGSEALAAWFEGHASLLGPSEREATLAEVRASPALAPGDRDRVLVALAGRGSRRDVLIEHLREDGAAAAMRQKPDASGLLSWQSGASVGVMRVLDDGRLGGFVVHRGSLAGALSAGWLRLPPGQRAEVVRGPASGNPAGGEDLHAIAMVAPELGLKVVFTDPRAVARDASRSRAILAGIGAGALAIAFALAAVLFARMRSARRSSELRTDFVSTVSHELRTPIASLRMLAELLEQDRVEPDERAEVYEALAREARRLGETVDRLLGFSRMAAGRYRLDRAILPVADAVAASIDTFEERHPDRPKVVRELDPEVTANIDAGQIRLAVDNLLANARKYAPDGEPYRVRVAAEGGGVSIRVQDQGPGIARRDQRRVFEPFERADDRLSRATEGSGIGLSLVQHVARAHGGRASVESNEGRGAAFTIWIPAR